MKIFVFLLFIFSATSGFANQTDSSESSCEFKGPEWTFARVIATSNLSPSEKLSALTNACQELNKYDWKGSFAQSRQGLKSHLSSALWSAMRMAGYVPAAFSHLDKSTTQREFMRELLSYKSIDDPILRIQKVYELVSLYQGNYDPNKKSIYRIPGVVVNRAQIAGSSGQCGDYALLLYWSLLQVARHPDDSKGMGGLSEKSFSMEPAYGNGKISDKDAGFHEWVRVNLPVRDKNGLINFESFDLDSTWYQGKFTPLMPRHQNLTMLEIEKRKQQCEQLQYCLSSGNFGQSLNDVHKPISRNTCSAQP